MSIGDIFACRIEKISSGGDGISFLKTPEGNKRVFIGLSAPGDELVCRITREHSHWVEAEIVEIHEASPLRMNPSCPFYGRCGGCSLQHLGYEAQLEAKKGILEEAFTRIGGFEKMPGIEIEASTPWEYRNRMQFHTVQPNHVRARSLSKKTIFPRSVSLLGLKARKSAEIVSLDDCPIADPLIRKALKNREDIKTPPGRDRFTVYARNGLLLSEGGTSRGKTALLGREIGIDAGVFFQSNGEMLEKLCGDILEAAEQAERDLPAADIFCGVGTFSFFLTGLFPRMELVEINRQALALARENLRFAAGKMEFFALSDEAWAKQAEKSCGFVVADPPREGFSPGLLAWFCEKGPPRLVYVSCDAATLARDAGTLKKGGYTLLSLKLFDFYPQTAHIESMAVFIRDQGRYGE
ncbi:MAG: methyltransferase [Treponema sp.]|jgi:23S rRNA (uracil1939-C5)-methyltransferase|nr:methyltransferase [Treponema sp.]